ncbi:sensor domain-containing diguanylate cyclase [Alteromonas sp. a30]|uniref:sensor domain-containing diguanylate cyclase n=1 Tax=Alteromonas sp. a30 TaxID=2730917 RepID=UPI00227DFD32|nr:GGDEF domain-containing protein [Alteromonas sp. a30]
MSKRAELEDIHLKHDLLGSIEVGILILDRKFHVQLWNQFMENHSGLTPNAVRDKCLFDLFEEIDRDWFTKKCDPVFALRSPAFIIWEQRPYVFKFNAYRPITSQSPHMYQNVTIFPLTSLSGEVEQICVVIYDVTLEAVSKQRFLSVNTQLQKMSRTDGLTGLYNRFYWEEMCELEFKRAKRTEQFSSLIILDIDHFKNINDTYGHPAGDLVIKTMAKIIKTAIRETDVAGRYGGEEYTIILPNTEAKSAKMVAERIRRLTEAFPVEYEGIEINFTISLGISMLDMSYDNYTTWIERADKGLYEAKERGRNRTVMSK